MVSFHCNFISKSVVFLSECSLLFSSLPLSLLSLFSSLLFSSLLFLFSSLLFLFSSLLFSSLLFSSLLFSSLLFSSLLFSSLLFSSLLFSSLLFSSLLFSLSFFLFFIFLPPWLFFLGAALPCFHGFRSSCGKSPAFNKMCTIHSKNMALAALLRDNFSFLLHRFQLNTCFPSKFCVFYLKTTQRYFKFGFWRKCF